LKIFIPAARFDHGKVLADVACCASENTLSEVIAATLYGRLHDDISNL
jgi:hypothetical protein